MEARPAPAGRPHPRCVSGSPCAAPARHGESGMPAGPKRRPPPQARSLFGLTLLSPSHPEVRRLQQAAVQPTLHGHKVWPTSLVLLDYLHQRGLPPQTHVLELDSIGFSILRLP